MYRESDKFSKRVLYLVTEDWYFASHRLGLAQQLCKSGFCVAVGTRVRNSAAAINDKGIEIIDIRFSRGLSNPLRELLVCISVIKAIRKFKPDIVNATALKPILSCIFAGYLFPKTKFVYAFAGMGYLFVGAGRKAGILRTVIRLALRLILSRPNSAVIVQNGQDEKLVNDIVDFAHDPTRLKVIRGVGVDVSQYSPVNSQAEMPLVVLPARMLKEKGVLEFVKAAEIVKELHSRARFVLVGRIDSDNPGALTKEQVLEFCSTGNVEWWGHRCDMINIYRDATLVCLPSYREGLPNALVEAAACGRAIVTTDVPGCREVCIDQQTGLLVAARDPHALAAAILRMLTDNNFRIKCETQARELALKEFSLLRISRETAEFFEGLMAATRVGER